jgi:hypothetical protein
LLIYDTEGYHTMMKMRPPDDQDADVMSVDFDGRSIVFLKGDEMDTSEDMDYVNGIGDLGERLTNLHLGDVLPAIP